ncbi:MAG: hypothetical protein RL684_1716 [Pseudomonadota bacterium]
MLRFAALLLLPLVIAQAMAAQPPARLPKIKVQDLHYGDVLFQFYAGDEFEALTRLEAYDQWGRMPNHRADAELLAGGLYLSLGMHNEAGDRFERLLTERIPVAVRDRAWFYLAKVWYSRGYYDRSEQALARISGQLAPVLEAERQHLLVNDLMRQQRYDEAAQRITAWQGPLDWMAYARFNLGVALVRQDRVADADPVLTSVGTLESANEELLSLRDKANLALGYAWLQAGNATAARTALDRVRLDGPYASRALLGVGWADAQLGDFREALTPWMELHERGLQDAAVQESFLAVPYAFGKLGAGAQSASYYEQAVKSFGEESGRLDDAIERIGRGQMLDGLLAAQKQQPTGQGLMHGWFWQLQQLPDSAESRYLYALLADNDFQEGLKNYRDLDFLGSTLARWEGSMSAFSAMIDTRQLADQARLPKADALLAGNVTARLLARRAELDARLTAIETGDDVAALGTADERRQWAQVRALEAALASDSGDAEELQIERDKIRLMKGVLYWQLDARFKERSYAQHRAIRSLDAALNEAQNRWVRVQQARGTVPNDLGVFSDRIAALTTRIAALREQLAGAAHRQEIFLEHLAQEELVGQKDRLAAYQVQARFALADLYDRSSNPPATPAPRKQEQATPEAEPAPAEAAPAEPAPAGAQP